MNILIIDAWLPAPDQDGGSLRMFNLLGVLKTMASGVTFAADDFAPRAYAYDTVRATGVHVLAPPEADSLSEYIVEHGAAYDIVILSRVAQATRYLPLVREHAPRARVIFDTTDLHYLRAFRGAKATGNIQLLRQALETRQHELAVVQAADATLVVSTVEQEILRQECPRARVRVISGIQPIHGLARPFGNREGIVFVGAFPHHPNADAMRYFFDDVYPHFKTRHDRVPITIIGSQPPEWLHDYASETVQITGHVPDIGPYLDGCRLTIAPLRYGAGIKSKVLLSMSYGVPVVLTSVAAEGIPCRDHRDVLIADEPIAFAEAIAALYRDESLWNRISENGIELVREHFSAEVARAGMVQVLKELQAIPVR